MANPPSQPDFLSAANILLGDNAPPAKFLAPNLPANTGLGTRQSLIQNERPATSGRKLIRWLIPDGPIVEMYINPQGISYGNRKSISEVRTKGGYNFQYWGPELEKLTITGTTGTSGIEGINVLEDVYNAEQLAFDPYALYLASKVQQETFSDGIFGDSALSAGDQFVSFLLNGSQAALPTQINNFPSLAALAFGIEMYYSGKVYHGFFTSFDVREDVSNLGMFDYTIGFTATQVRGYRQNYFAWHRSATSGPSNSDPTLGTPHSFGSLVGGGNVPRSNF